MNTKKASKRKYPLLGVRVSVEEMRYLRREAKERNMKVSKYVKAILVPSWAINGK